MLYSATEIKQIHDCGERLANILGEVVLRVRSGITTAALDHYAEQAMRQQGGEPSFLNYQGGGTVPFPSTLCVSINNEVVHGSALPSRTLRDGDLVSLDIGMRYPAVSGFCTDMAVTVGVGSITTEANRLLRVTREALDRGIGAAMPGKRVRDISRAVQQHVEQAGFSVVRDLVGHGVGRAVHEEPEVPNFIAPGAIGDYQLNPGLVIAIEPMVNAGRPAVRTRGDGWTVVTRDGSLSAHFEQTIAIESHGHTVLTPFVQ